jgi:hypothetical protein
VQERRKTMPAFNEGIRFGGGVTRPGGPPLQGWASTARPAAPGKRTAIPENAFRSGGGYMPPPSLPPIQEPMRLQETPQPGWFEGSVTFLSAEVDPDGSQPAAEAVAKGDIDGENIVRGLFHSPRTKWR